MDNETNVICIYCKKTGSSREHVAPASIGGNCVIDCVCQGCNKELSVVDKGLAEHSAVALTKVADTPPSSFKTQLGGHASFQSEETGPTTVRIGNQMVPEVRPQFFLEGNHLRASAADRNKLNELLNFVDKLIAKGRLSETRIFIDQNAPHPHFCMHRSDDAVVSCASRQDGVHLLSVLETHWPEIKAGFTAAPEQIIRSRPEVTVKMTWKPNDEFRGVAKIAFETVAHLLGSQVALCAQFDPIRNYIRGELQLPDTLGPGEIAVDTRFVRRLGTEFTLGFTKQHGVLLLASPPNLIAFVLLYGQHPYFIHLAGSGFDRQWIRVYEFSYTKDGHGELNELEFAKRMIATSPEAFGIQGADVAELLTQLGDPTRRGSP